ncbi:TPA: hypothetical protein ACHC9S_001554 [Streptococcus pyogenes]|nr:MULTISPECIES: hypothetical protein [Streptococcus]EQL81190.1 hypothetical protein HMPREF1225_1906 [Streptococcus pyogenes UTSW-2]QBX14160.1 hypothetical protein Javan129_0009 [Streptococcus phage Javan129]QBX23494.1 hypothetical protein Javan132_0060 [Streptococcus phage Javan132]HER4776445.1 hypothetical protein [Streptococcus pyogenes NGAS169]EZK78366.1 hypothetical protein Z449_01804 [Streptococcus pyogenes ABC020026946]
MISKEQIAHDLAIAMMTAEFSQEKYHRVSFTQITKYKEYYKRFLSEL